MVRERRISTSHLRAVPLSSESPSTQLATRIIAAAEDGERDPEG